MQKINKVLVPVDFTPTSSDAFQYALHLADIFKAALHIVHVRTFAASLPEFSMVPMITIAPDFTGEQMGVFLKQARRDQELLNLSHINVTQEIRGGDPVREIVQFTKEKEADLVVMGAIGPEDFVDKLTGSVAWEVVYKACCPVWIVPSKAVYKPVNCIVYATNEESASPKLIHELAFLNSFLSAKIHYIYMDDDTPKENRDQTVQHLSESIHAIEPLNAEAQIEVLKENNLVGFINSYIDQNHADMLIFASRQRNYWSRLFSETLTEKIAAKINLPILFLHKNDNE